MTQPNHFYTHVNKWGNDILFRGYRFLHDTQTWQRIQKRIPYAPVMYVPTQDSSKSQHRTIHGEPLAPYNFLDMKTAKKEMGKFSGYQWYGMERFEYQAISNTYDGVVPFNAETLRTGILDIETTCERGFPHVEQAIESVIVISIYDVQTDTIYTLGDKSYGSYTPSKPNVKYIGCNDEQDLLEKFIKLWKKLDFDIVTGWNTQFFDLPYLYNRIWRVTGDENLSKSISPWKIVQSRQVFLNNRHQISMNFYGIASLDYLDLYKKFRLIQRSSYKLDNIANIELGEKKISYEEHDSMHTFYKSDWQKFVDYNIHDVVLIKRLEQKLKFIDLALTMCYTAKVNIQDVYSQVRLWDSLIYNYLSDQNIMIPVIDMSNNEKSAQYAGAYVKEPICGLHKWVMSYDLASLYPMLIRQFNISPETKRNEHFNHVEIDDLLDCSFDTSNLVPNKITMAGSGHAYSTEKPGFLGELLMNMYQERSKYKKLMVQESQNLEQIKQEMERRGIK